MLSCLKESLLPVFEMTMRKLYALTHSVSCNVCDNIDPEPPGISCTGAKGVALVLCKIREVWRREKVPIPKTMIDREGNEFEEIEEFLKIGKSDRDIALEWCGLMTY